MVKPDKQVLFDAVMLTAEVMGYALPVQVATDMAHELAAYPLEGVIAALRQCKRECKGKLTLTDILQRIDDGHLGIEQAWALCPRDESASVIWTDEIAQAFAAAEPLLAQRDQVGARMAFKEAYTALLQQARNERRAAKWWPSLGHDAAQRASVVMTAVDVGRLAPNCAAGLLPSGAEFDGLRDRLLAAADAPRALPATGTT